MLFRTHRALLAIAFALTAHGHLSAQPVWNPLPAGGLPTLGLPAAAFDIARGKVVVFGGLTSTQPQDETYEWDGVQWITRTPATVPPARSAAAMAFDEARNRIVMFGGSTDAGFVTALNDTWEWDGTDWQQFSPATVPPARLAGTMCFDSQRGRVILFGGRDGAPTYPDGTWEWDGVDWTLITNTGPSGRCCHSMSNDLYRSRVVLFGGSGPAQAVYGDTWEWDGFSWTQQTVSGPAARWGHASTFDIVRGVTVLYGGYQSPAPGTWEWDGATWTSVTGPEPGNRYNHQLTFDWISLRSILIGGGGVSPFTVWTYGNPVPSSYTPVGNGCPGSAGTPTLASTGLDPTIGEPFQLTVSNVPSDTSVAFAFGSSTTSLATTPLPIDLAPLGMPGCQLLSNIITVETRVVDPGLQQVSFDIAIPYDLSLLTYFFSNQAFVLDAGANPLGLTVSNGGFGVVGG